MKSVYYNPKNNLIILYLKNTIISSIEYSNYSLTGNAMTNIHKYGPEKYGYIKIGTGNF